MHIHKLQKVLWVIPVVCYWWNIIFLKIAGTIVMIIKTHHLIKNSLKVNFKECLLWWIFKFNFKYFITVQLLLFTWHGELLCELFWHLQIKDWKHLLIRVKLPTFVIKVWHKIIVNFPLFYTAETGDIFTSKLFWNNLIFNNLIFNLFSKTFSASNQNNWNFII